MEVLGFPNGSKKTARGGPIGGTRYGTFAQEGCSLVSWQGTTLVIPGAYLRGLLDMGVIWRRDGFKLPSYPDSSAYGLSAESERGL